MTQPPNNYYGPLIIPALTEHLKQDWMPALNASMRRIISSGASSPPSGEQMLPSAGSTNPPNLLPFYSNLLLGNPQGLPNVVRAFQTGSLAPIEQNASHSIDQQLKAATDFSDGKLSPGDLNLALQLATGDLGPNLADRPFYSPLEAFTSLSKDSPLSATPEVWKNYLQAAQKKGAFKNEEAEDTGLWNWLDKLTAENQEKVKGLKFLQDVADSRGAGVQLTPDALPGMEPTRLRREDVRQFVADNRPQLYTYTKGGGKQDLLGQHLNSIHPGERSDAESFLGMAIDNFLDSDSPDEAALGHFLQGRPPDDYSWWHQFALDEPGTVNQWNRQYRELAGIPDQPEDEGGHIDFSGVPKYKDYSSPGGSDYRETLFRVPKIDYVGPHWNEPDIMMHIRSQTMPDVAGKTAHHVEEVQSDFHQAHQGEVSNEALNTYGPQGRKFQLLDPQGKVVADSEEGWNSIPGVTSPYDQQGPQRMLSIETRANLLNDMGRKLGMRPGQWHEFPPEVLQRALGSDIIPADVRHGMADPPGQSMYTTGLYLWMKAHPDQVRLVDPIPETPEFTPWSKSWPLLGMKQAMKEANDKGLDRVSFTPGEVQNKRYGNFRGSKEQAGMSKFYDERLVNDLNKFLKKYGSKVQKGTSVRSSPLRWDLRERVNGNGDPIAWRPVLTYGLPDGREVTPSDIRRFYLSRDEAEQAARQAYADLAAGSSRAGKEQHTNLHYFDITPALKKQIENGMPLY